MKRLRNMVAAITADNFVRIMAARRPFDKGRAEG